MRTLSVSEERWLSERQKAYLRTKPFIQCLQPGALPQEALYGTVRHGAVTLDRAMELDEIHDRFLAQAAKSTRGRPGTTLHDAYTDAEDRFIDTHGFSSTLN